MKLLADRGYLKELLPSIRSAGKEIIARIFLIDPGSEKNSAVVKILSALAEARKRGVSVQIHTDNIFRFKPSGKRLTNSAKKLGLTISWDANDTVLHEKTVYIDGRILFLGSHNWTVPSLTENHELTVKLSPVPALVPGTGLSVRSSSRGLLPRRVRLDALAFTKQLVDDIDHAESEILLGSFDIDESTGPYEFGTRFTDSLIRARSRGLAVKVLLDSSVTRIPETGEMLYHLRGLKKAEDLVRAGVSVYYDTTLRLFHTKAAVIDRLLAYVGSQNIEMRKDVTAMEATLRAVSKTFASKVRTYLESAIAGAIPYFYEPSSLVGMPLPLSFMEKKGVLNRLYKAAGVTLLPFYLRLLRLAWQDKLQEYRKHFTIDRMFRYRLLKMKRGFRALDYNYRENDPRLGIDRIELRDPLTQKPLTFPNRDYFIIPDTFFDYGWLDKLNAGRTRNIFFYLIHLAQSQNSETAPYWSMRIKDISRRYGADMSNVAHATIGLEKWNLIDVIRDPKITVKGAVKRPNRYRVNPPWDEREHELIKKKMLEEFSVPGERMKEAEVLAALLNQDHDLDVIRKFLLLIDRYGPAEVRKAARITARFKHHFALRAVGHTAGILRNWSMGIHK